MDDLIAITIVCSLSLRNARLAPTNRSRFAGYLESPMCNNYNLCNDKRGNCAVSSVSWRRVIVCGN